MSVLCYPRFIMLLRFYPYVGIWRFYIMTYAWVYDVYILEMYVIYPLRLLINFIYACCFEIYWRRSVYFLNNCIFRVLYCFNRSRALQVGIRAWLVLSGLEFGEFPVCTRVVLSYLWYLFCWLVFPLYATCTEVLSVLVPVFRSFRRVWAKWGRSGILQVL